MNIKLDGNIILTSDDKQFILKTEYQNAGKQQNRDNVIGYYGDLKHALTAYIKVRQLCSDATSIKDLIELQNSLKTYLKNVFKELKF